MKKNVGSTDRIVRLFMAIFVLYGLFNVVNDSLGFYVCIGLTVYLALTALLQFCLLYFLLGLSTVSTQFKGRSKKR